MKKIISGLMLILMLTGMLTACSSTKTTDQKKQLSIVCTVFPEYDWVKEILGSHTQDADITMLLDNGVDLHSYQPTADDIIKISTCDLFIYVGGESDKWVADALKQATNKAMVVVNLLEVLGNAVKEEEVIEGMESVEEEAASNEAEEGPEYDEHVWLSLKSGKILCNYIAGKLSEIDTDHAADYKANAISYMNQLNTLDQSYQQMVDSAKQKTLVFGDRFPFRYLVDDYNLSYYAAFVGCSAETEASFETIAFLAKKVDDFGLGSVVTIEGTNHKIAETVIQNTKDKNQKILVLNSMQSTTSLDVKNGTTYLSIMQSNLDVLREALN